MRLRPPTLLTLHRTGLFTRLPHLALALLLLMTGGGLRAQASDSPVFPETRYRQLLREVRFERPPEPTPEEPVETEPWSVSDISLPTPVTYLILGLLLLALGFLVYRVLSDVNLRKRTRTRGEDEDRISIEEIEEEALVASGVSLSLMERAERAEQFDVAVRLLYIQLLKDLQDGGLIRYRRDYSNRDYRIQLDASPLLPDFRDVTVDYERYWYGKYPIDPLTYRLVKRKFSALTSRIVATGQLQADET